MLPTSSIYDGIENIGLPDDQQTWTSGASIVFERLVREAAPKTIIEVGSWKGVTAVRMAKVCPEAKVYCVDTWLGGLEQLCAPSRDYRIPRDQHGASFLYHQFLTNVKKNGVHERITPIQNTSAIGAKLLKREKVSAEFIYIDGSHDYEDAYADLRAYWPLLATPGVMLIDDYSMYHGVYAAVTRFTEEMGLWESFDTADHKTFAVLRKKAA